MMEGAKIISKKVKRISLRLLIVAVIFIIALVLFGIIANEMVFEVIFAPSIIGMHKLTRA